MNYLNYKMKKDKPANCILNARSLKKITTKLKRQQLRYNKNTENKKHN
jgi:hypothetical protein